MQTRGALYAVFRQEFSPKSLRSWVADRTVKTGRIHVFWGVLGAQKGVILGVQNRGLGGPKGGPKRAIMRVFCSRRQRNVSWSSTCTRLKEDSEGYLGCKTRAKVFSEWFGDFARAKFSARGAFWAEKTKKSEKNLKQPLNLRLALTRQSKVGWTSRLTRWKGHCENSTTNIL